MTYVVKLSIIIYGKSGFTALITMIFVVGKNDLFRSFNDMKAVFILPDFIGLALP